MPINVICPGCHARFKASDQFAGRKGPCPRCKAIIRVPALDEQVVIHAPEHSELGARDAEGRHVLKPIAREKTKLQPIVAVAIVGASLLVLIVALALRGVADKRLILAVGAIVLAPPLALGGYTFLRDDELEPYRGRSFAARTLICSAVYASTWGAYGYFYGRLFGDAPAETWNVLPFALVFLGTGAATAHFCYDLDLGSGFFHYSLYLLITILLRWVMGLPAV